MGSKRKNLNTSGCLNLGANAEIQPLTRSTSDMTSKCPETYYENIYPDIRAFIRDEVEDNLSYMFCLNEGKC